MSDAGRKSVGDQLTEKAKPDSQKSTFEKASESVTSATDKLAGSAQPSGDKSATQQASDSVRGSSGNAGDKGYLESASDTVSDTLNSVTGNKK